MAECCHGCYDSVGGYAAASWILTNEGLKAVVRDVDAVDERECFEATVGLGGDVDESVIRESRTERPLNKDV
ncbi:hypothetical protein Ahy_B03g062477 isoform D [Arachis hypogaea]|uniref:Uncharacterized protein n=1 Tax=Arachis hypogaea TaxID=3818 RepID=A0A444ZU87_ARAHY|nr:hypothetical protein Ahy_B03g062477 isoform D [Arachis hypogaea]